MMQDRDGVQASDGAGTPSPLDEGLKNATGEFAALELDRVLDHVAGYARGPLGGDRVRARRPVADPVWIAAELAPVAELLALWERGEIDIPPVPELASVLARLRVQGSVLSGSD